MKKLYTAIITAGLALCSLAYAEGAKWISSADNKDLSGTLTNALTNGVITEGELAALQGGTFLRADLAYVSYYALDAAVSGSRQTLGDTLMDKGVFTVREKQAADALVTSGRK